MCVFLPVACCIRSGEVEQTSTCHSRRLHGPSTVLLNITSHVAQHVQVFACPPKVDDILPFVRAFHALVRRRPFLVQRLEEVLTKLLTSLEFFDDEGRQKIAIGAILCS